MSGLIKLLYPPFVGGRIAVGLLLLRAVAGFALFFHGLQKMAGSPFDWMGPDSWAPPFLQFLAAFAECFGGLAPVVGLLTPLAALGIAATMGGATFVVHMAGGAPLAGPRGAQGAERVRQPPHPQTESRRRAAPGRLGRIARGPAGSEAARPFGRAARNFR